MTDEQPDLTSQGHVFDPSPFLLDLLLCTVLADQRIATLARRSQPIFSLQQEYLRTEVTRILISTAVALRIVFDREGPNFKKHQTDCGKLYPDWAKQKKKTKALPLREACNKIIHATSLGPRCRCGHCSRRYKIQWINSGFPKRQDFP